MKHLTHMLHALVRLVRPSQGVHVSPFGYVRELVCEVQRRRNRSRRVRRYAERIPHLGSGIDGDSVVPASSGAVRIDERPVPPRVPAPRRPSLIPSSIGSSAYDCPVRAGASINVSVPAAIVRGRCFVSGRATGARPVESRKLALAVLCALADQGRSGLDRRGLDVDLDPGLGLDPRALDRPEEVRPGGVRPDSVRSDRARTDRVRSDRVRSDRAPGRDMLVVGEAA